MTSTETYPDQTAGPVGRRTFLRAHAVLIVCFAALVTVTAGALSYQQPPTYTSVARVVVEPQLLPNGGAPPAPDMATEKAVAMSSAVTTAAAAVLGLPLDQASAGLSISVPVDTHVLEFSFTGEVPQTVARRTEAFSQAYVDYRSFHSTSSGKLVPQLAEIITPASLPTSPSGPDHLLQIGAALLLGLALGIGVAAASDRWDRRVRGPGHLAELTHSPVLAVVPRPKLSGPQRLVLTSSPRSDAAEAYRFLHAKLLDPLASRGIGTLLVTCSSDRDREARDVVAANLAAAAAEAGRAVVVVADTVDRVALENLLGHRQLGGAVMLHPGLDINVEVVKEPRAGTLTPSPGSAKRRTTPRSRTVELSAEARTLEQLSQRYDVVIVQAAPLKSSARTLMRLRQCDACLLVVDTQLSERDDVQEAHREIRFGSRGLVTTVLTQPSSAGRSGIRTRAEHGRTSQIEQPQLSSRGDAARTETLA